MSRRHEMVELVPPLHRQMKELVVSRGHECANCNGSGKVSEYELGGGFEFVTCPVCNGTGKVDAIVTIKWKPSKMRKNGKFKA